MTDPCPHPCRCVIVSGVAGSGKSTLARLLADQLQWTCAEGDTFHPQRNIVRMRAGIALTDADRASWLAAIATWIDHHSPRSGTVVTCSALRRTYREELVDGRPWLRFCQLEAPRHILVERMTSRTGHFMPASLLDSQLGILEPLGFNEPGIVMNATEPPARLVEDVVDILDLAADAAPCP
jgi:gluconokinase